ncbi:hypothetical protein HYV64_03860 [Candidatus Shapirobacteria bacterium]|nr:hypothetical protein [Candidatus Shapirobacteria bacterium]
MGFGNEIIQKMDGVPPYLKEVSMVFDRKVTALRSEFFVNCKDGDPEEVVGLFKKVYCDRVKSEDGMRESIFIRKPLKLVDWSDLKNELSESERSEYIVNDLIESTGEEIAKVAKHDRSKGAVEAAFLLLNGMPINVVTAELRRQEVPFNTEKADDPLFAVLNEAVMVRKSMGEYVNTQEIFNYKGLKININNEVDSIGIPLTVFKYSSDESDRLRLFLKANLGINNKTISADDATKTCKWLLENYEKVYRAQVIDGETIAQRMGEWQFAREYLADVKVKDVKDLKNQHQLQSHRRSIGNMVALRGVELYSEGDYYEAYTQIAFALFIGIPTDKIIELLDTYKNVSYDLSGKSKEFLSKMLVNAKKVEDKVRQEFAELMPEQVVELIV